ncbi:unnamed protein product [Sympodiomycopsis kandeliae]
MTSLQEQLERLYCPPLDSSLVAAIANDHGQTLQSAKEVLDSLVSDIDQDPAPPGGSTSESASPSLSASTTSRNDDTGTSATSDDVERMLDEFNLAEEYNSGKHSEQDGDPEVHLKLTDDEGSEAGDGEGPISRPFPEYDDRKQQTNNDGGLRALRAGSDPIDFLNHAFPTRTRAFLIETLTDCEGDVGITIDTLMAIDLAEREAAESEAKDIPAPSSGGKKGLDYEALSSGGGSSSSHRVKGKKGRAMRKQAQQEYLKSIGEDTAPIKGPLTKVTFGDIRQGGGTNDRRALKSAEKQRGGPHTSNGDEIPRELQGMSDFEIAQHLAKEEDPDAGEAVRDNQWLLTSSVLSQLSTLLEVEPSTITSTYNKSSFNLHIAVGRLIDTSASEYPTLETLEEAGSAPSGTAMSLVNSLSSLSGKNIQLTSLCLRATKGRQDATLDLLNLLDVVKQAAGNEVPDELDPLGRLKGELGEDATAKKNKESLESSQRGVSMNVNQQDPLPGESSGMDAKLLQQMRLEGSNSKFAKAAITGHHNANIQPSGQAKAMAALRDSDGSSNVISFPPSSGTIGNSSSSSIPTATQYMYTSHPSSSSSSSTSMARQPRTIQEKEDAIYYYRSLAEEYQQRRNDCLSKASSAWRTAASKNKSAAFYYADEARRLDFKSRAFNLKSSQALVEFRKSNRGEDSYSHHNNNSIQHKSHSGVVDLHGVTVREALSIVQDELNQWWSLPSGANTKRSLTIITGAGKHSPNQVAILTPSVAKYLQREGWKADVDRSRGVITVRGR